MQNREYTMPSYQDTVYVLLMGLGINDAEKALDADPEVCQKLLIDLATTPEFAKFLRYMRG